jgi:hypothetical protein
VRREGAEGRKGIGEEQREAREQARRRGAEEQKEDMEWTRSSEHRGNR